MRLHAIRKAARHLYDAAGALGFSCEIIQKSYAAAVPGNSPVLSETRYPVRLIKMKSGGSRFGQEEGPVLEKALHRGFLECEDCIPAAEDDLELDGIRYVISKATAADMGAGILYEVWYS